MPFRSTEETSLRTAASLDAKEKASQEGADLLLSLAETASEHAHITEEREKSGITAVSLVNMAKIVSQNSHVSRNSPVLSSEKEIQSGESSDRGHMGHAYGWQRPYYYHHPYGGMHLPYPHYPMPTTEEVTASPPRKRVVLESIIENPCSKDVKRPRGEESRQESPTTAQSPRSTTDYKDNDDEAEKSTKRESVISPSSSNETQQVTDSDSQQEDSQKASRPDTPGLTSDQSRQYPAYHGVRPPYLGYPPGFAAPHPFHYGAHPAYPYCAPPPFYYRGGGGMMQSAPSSFTNTNNKPTVSPSPPRSTENDKMTAMKGLVLAAHSDLLKSFPAGESSIFPNYNRCIPLKQPLPGRSWSRDAEDAQQNAMPDFSQLVNFPDYLARGREGKAGATANDNKNCVMCGKLRPCSVSTMNRRTGEDAEDEGAIHIIPRQNKGVCTACDVAVWAVTGAKLDDGTPIEIKWCKGCKNFRPWAAFGEKGSATKCVRCRNRQKEKYAAAKVKLELPQAMETYAR